MADGRGTKLAARASNEEGAYMFNMNDAAAQTVVETTVVCLASQAEKALELDENDVTFGGGIGTDLTFSYVAKDVVFVTGSIMVNVDDTAIDALQATSFTGTGY